MEEDHNDREKEEETQGLLVSRSSPNTNNNHHHHHDEDEEDQGDANQQHQQQHQQHHRAWYRRRSTWRLVLYTALVLFVGMEIYARSFNASNKKPVMDVLDKPEEDDQDSDEESVAVVAPTASSPSSSSETTVTTSVPTAAPSISPSSAFINVNATLDDDTDTPTTTTVTGVVVTTSPPPPSVSPLNQDEKKNDNEISIRDEVDDHNDHVVDVVIDDQELRDRTNVPIRPETVTDLSRLQIERYRQGTGLLMNLHITHHGGTSFCSTIGYAKNTPDPPYLLEEDDEKNGNQTTTITKKPKTTTPSFACWKVRPPKDNVSFDYPHHNPWWYNETARNINIVRRYFHMISWEYSGNHPPHNPSIADTNLEHENLLSIIVMRHPMQQMLAGDGQTAAHFPHILHGDSPTLEEWWNFAHWHQTDNFALHVLAGSPDCCHGNTTDRKHLRAAQDLIRRFSIVLDIECLNEGMQALADVLNITIAHPRGGKAHAPPQERINHTDVYEYLVDKNKLNIELYEWSKTLALVNCSALPSSSSSKNHHYQYRHYQKKRRSQRRARKSRRKARSRMLWRKASHAKNDTRQNRHPILLDPKM